MSFFRKRSIHIQVMASGVNISNFDIHNNIICEAGWSHTMDTLEHPQSFKVHQSFSNIHPLKLFN